MEIKKDIELVRRCRGEIETLNKKIEIQEQRAKYGPGYSEIKVQTSRNLHAVEDNIIKLAEMKQERDEKIMQYFVQRRKTEQFLFDYAASKDMDIICNYINGLDYTTSALNKAINKTIERYYKEKEIELHSEKVQQLLRGKYGVCKECEKKKVIKKREEEDRIIFICGNCGKQYKLKKRYERI